MQLTLLKTFHQLSVVLNGDFYYDFANSQIPSHALNNHCGAIHATFVLILFAYGLYGRVTVTYAAMTPPLLTFDFVTFCLLTSLNLTIILSSRRFFAKRTHAVVHSLSRVDKNLRDFADRTGKTSYPYVVFFVIVVSLLTMCFDCVAWICIFRGDFHYHASRNLQYLMVFVKLLFSHQFMQEVSRKLSHLKEYVVCVVIDGYPPQPVETEREEDGEAETTTGLAKSVLDKWQREENSRMKSATRNFNETAAAWRDLLATCRATTIAFHALFVAEFLHMTCHAIAYSFGNLSGSVMGNSLLLGLRALWSFCLLIWLLTFACTCSETCDALAQLLKHCYQFLLNVNVNGIYAIEHNLFQEFFVLFDLIDRQIDGADSFGAFRLNRAHFFGLAIGLTSFTAVLVQFNSL